MQSPATSGYPGTPMMLIIIGFCAFMVVKSVLQVHKVRRGIADRKDPSGDILFGIMAAFLLFMALWAVWAHYAAPT